MSDTTHTPATAALVPVSTAGAIPAQRGSAVLGTARLLDGELIVQLRPTTYRDVTGHPVGPSPDVEVAPHPLARLGLRYVGPLTPAEAARIQADVAWWDARPWWRRWGTGFADWCWR
jgi:hypothetical protein